jgi:ribulose-bisphosphate carboxylase large chain
MLFWSSGFVTDRVNGRAGGEKAMIFDQRFDVVYRIKGNEPEAWRKAWEIGFEQTVGFPEALVPESMYRDGLVGRIEEYKRIDDGIYEVKISYAAETTANELTQLLNVIFGSISLKPGIRVERIELTDSIFCHFPGPRFGRSGIREALGVMDRPLLSAALKPMGFNPEQLASTAYQYALGGIDIIQDNHRLTDQVFAPFEERVARCAEAVARANRETGRRSIYVANITAPADQIGQRARIAKERGAGGLLVAPGLTGFDVIRLLAGDPSFGLPIFSHPAFLGSYATTPDNGIAHVVLFGQIPRLAGADAVIYPNYGGRSSFSRADCQAIIGETGGAMGTIQPIFPCPAGVLSPDRIGELLDVYGKDVIFLIDGGLFKPGQDLVENCRSLRRLAEGSET